MFTDEAAILQAAAAIASARIIARSNSSQPIISPPSAGAEIRLVLVSMVEAGLIDAQAVPPLPAEEDDAA